MKCSPLLYVPSIQTRRLKFSNPRTMQGEMKNYKSPEYWGEIFQNCIEMETISLPCCQETL